MATLELAIDGRPMQAGAQQAQQALEGVTRSATTTAAAVDRIGTSAQRANVSATDFGRNINKAFQATGGTIQVSQGIASTAKALSDLNGAAAAFGASRTLLEIGKTVQDFRELGSAVGKTSGFFGTLGAVIRGNPILVIASALGTVGTLMGIFSDNTKKAADAYEELATAMSKARMDAQTAAYLGVQGPSNQGQMQALFNAVGQARQSGAGINLQQLGELGGGRTAVNYLAQSGTPQQQAAAREYLRTGGYYTTYDLGGVEGGASVSTFNRGVPPIQLDAAQTQEVLRLLYRDVADKAATVAKEQSQLYQFGRGEFPRFAEPDVVGLPETFRPPSADYQIDPRTGEYRSQYQTTPGGAPYYIARPEPQRITMSEPGFVDMPGGYYREGAIGPEPDYQMTQQMAEVDKQALENARQIAELKAQEAESARMSAMYAGQIGATFGSALADVLMKTTTLRQAFASIVASFARQGLADVGSAIFRGVVTGGVTGATSTQMQGNAGLTTPGAPR